MGRRWAAGEARSARNASSRVAAVLGVADATCPELLVACNAQCTVASEGTPAGRCQRGGGVMEMLSHRGPAPA